MLVGLLIAAMAAEMPGDGRATMNVPVALLLLLLPLADTVLAVVRRSLRGQSFAEADRGHIHHRLLDRGGSVWKALRVLGGLGLANGCLAWAAAVKGQELLAWTVVAAGLPLLVYARVLGHHEWQLLSGKLAEAVTAWRPGMGQRKPREGQMAASQSVAIPQTQGAAIPQPHFRRSLQPSSHGGAAELKATEARP